MKEERRTLPDHIQTMTANMAEQEDRQVSAPEKRNYRQTGLGATHVRPHHQHRDRKDKRFAKQPGEAQIAAAPAQLYLAHQQRPDDPALDGPSPHKTRQLFSPTCWPAAPKPLGDRSGR